IERRRVTRRAVRDFLRAVADAEDRVSGDEPCSLGRGAGDEHGLRLLAPVVLAGEPEFLGPVDGPRDGLPVGATAAGADPAAGRGGLDNLDVVAVRLCDGPQGEGA